MTGPDGHRLAVEQNRDDASAEHDIASRLAAGDSAGWLGLYEAYFDRVWRLVGQFIGPDASAVADVVQDTFLSAARSARRFDAGRGTLWAWLAGIARMRVFDHFRSRRRDSRVEAGDVGQARAREQLARWLDGDADNPTSAALSAEQAELVRRTLAGLPPEYGAVLIAHYIEESPVAQIARDQGRTVEAVRSQLARARRAFRADCERPANKQVSP